MDTTFRTLKDFFRSLGLPLDQDFELTVHRLKGLHGSGPAQAPAFRTNYYAFLLITAGHSHYTIDNQEFECKAGAFYFTNPGHLKSFRIHEPIEGYMLTFSEEFVKQNYAGDFFQQFPFLLHETTPVMQLGGGPVKELGGLLEAMLHEYQGQALYKKAILTNQLLVLLYKTKELLPSHQVAVRSSGRAAELMGQFKALVNRNFADLAAGKATKILSVKELAEALSVHPNYLGNVPGPHPGRGPGPAGQHGQNRIGDRLWAGLYRRGPFCQVFQEIRCHLARTVPQADEGGVVAISIHKLHRIIILAVAVAEPILEFRVHHFFVQKLVDLLHGVAALNFSKRVDAHVKIP
ncbi:MAG: AraC family ligand binding domain-containing protein [Bernardetiaceae bacterium]|nr:AraC family ligand binding domain-containing protein [Bernardetiaceae bacterium]